MPPGSAKSTYGSILGPAWATQLGWAIIAASHTVTLAEKWGRRVRNLLLEHGPVLGVSLRDDSQAADRWACTNGTEYMAAGAGTAIPGFRAKLGIIDDPVSGSEAADSELQRDKLWEWYLGDFRPRLVPGARQILIQTRWHEDDLAGRLLQHGNWHVLSLPALAEDNDPLGRSPGQPLWSDDSYGFGAQLLERAKDTPPRIWSAQYQQRPAPEEGDYFKADWLKTYTSLPPRAEMQTYGGSDYAVTADGGDYTVHAVVGLDAEGRIYLLDIWRRQASSDVWVEAFCDLVREWKPLGWAEEKGQIAAGVGPLIDQRSRQRQAFVAREQFPVRADKAVRAQSIRGRMALDGLYLPANAPWVAELRSELLHFPAGKHDDQVDALGLIGQLLDVMVSGTKPKLPEKPKFNDYKPREFRSPAHPMVL